MAALNIILLVLFIIVCVLIVFLVLLQNEEGDSIGGLFAGGSNSAFGSKSGNVLTKSTYVLVTIFFAFSFILAVLNKSASSPSEKMRKEGQELQQKEATPWYDTEKKEATDNAKPENSTEEKKDASVKSEEREPKVEESSNANENAVPPTAKENTDGDAINEVNTDDLRELANSDLKRLQEEAAGTRREAENLTPMQPVEEEMTVESSADSTRK